MPLGNFTANQGTQTAIAIDSIGGGTVMAVQKVDISPLGASGTIWGGGVTGTINSGSIVVTAGTIASDTIVGGTLGSVLGVGGTTSVSVVNGTVSVNEISGTLNLGTVSMTSGTINALGTMGTLGTITNIGQVYNAGTLQAGANIIGNIGTIYSGTAVLNSGTINVGTFVMPSGTLNVGTATTNQASGTLNVGTINSSTVNIGTVYKGIGAGQSGSLTAAGTITAAGSQLDLTYWDIGGTYVGTVQFQGQVGTSGWFGVNVITPTGAVGTQTTGNGDYMQSMAGLDNARAVFTYSSGTLTYNNRSSNFYAPLNYMLGGSIGNVGMVNAATISSLPNLPQGSINVTAGTMIMTTGTINAGTINTGTINAGTINVGTVQINPLTATNTISHAGTSGTLGIGTLVAAPGASTAAYITNFRIVAISGTPEVILAFGTVTNGNQIVHHGLYPAGGGIANPIPYPHGYGTTNSPLTYQILSGAGTVSWDVDYFAHT